MILNHVHMVCILLWIAWQCCVAIVEGNSDVRPPDTLDYDTLDHDNGDSNLETSLEEEYLADIFLQMQKLSEETDGITHVLSNEQKVSSLFEDDIKLTLEQAEALLEDLKGKKRRKRKLTLPIIKRWKFPIPYMFDGTHSFLEVSRIHDAISYWEELTCIKFKFDPSARFKLLFTKGRGCWSYVGYTHQVNQTISIGDGCQSNGTIAHEIGHAVGFWHEQSRPDRDEFVQIHKLNVTDGKEYNFDKRTWGEIIALEVPYDLGSDMHYGSKFYASDANSSLVTVETRDIHMSRVIGQRQELSFYDVKLANKAYCIDYCSNAGITLPKPCARDGYQDPTDCERCRCPDGFGGPYCEKHAESINAYCGGFLRAEFNGTIASPGYLYGNLYAPDVSCSWLIVAPEGYSVYLQFVDEFGISGHVDLCKDFVEVRYNTSLAHTGARYCCDDPPRSPIISDSNEMLVLFRSFSESRTCDDAKYPWKCRTLFTGFKAIYYTNSCGGCSYHHRSRLPVSVQACVKRLSYTCLRTWKQKVTLPCSGWWKNEDCGVKWTTSVRYSTCYRDEYYCCVGYMVLGRLCTVISIEDLQESVIDDSYSARSTLNDLHASDSDNTIDIYRTDNNNLPHNLPHQYNNYYTHEDPNINVLSPVWSSWGAWGSCSHSCGGGIRSRVRECLSRDYQQCNVSDYDDITYCPNIPPCYQVCHTTRKELCKGWKLCRVNISYLCKPFCMRGFVQEEKICAALTPRD